MNKVEVIAEKLENLVDEKATTESSQMLRGSRLVMSGFAVAVVGIIGYCLISFSILEGSQAMQVHSDVRLATLLSIGVIALGTLLWLIGSFLYLDASMKSYSKED